MSNLDKVGATLQGIMRQFSSVSVPVLVLMYRIREGCKLPWENYGYDNPVSFLREKFANLLTIQEEHDAKGATVHSVTLRRSMPPPKVSRERKGKSSVSLPQNHAGDRHAPNTASTSSRNDTSVTSITTKVRHCKVVPAPFRAYLAHLLKAFPHGVRVNEFVETFLTKSSSTLNYKMYGYPSHLSMFRDLSDVFRLEVNSSGEHMLYPASVAGKQSSRPDSRDTANGCIGDHRSDTNACTSHKKVQGSATKDKSAHSPSLQGLQLGFISIGNTLNNRGELGESSAAWRRTKQTKLSSLNGSQAYSDKIARTQELGSGEPELPRNDSNPRVPSKDSNPRLPSKDSNPWLPSKDANSRQVSRAATTTTTTTAQKNSAVYKAPSSYGELFVVDLHDSFLVPVACLAFLAGMSPDRVLETLSVDELDPSKVRFLSAQVTDHKTIRVDLALAGCPLIVNSDGTIANVIALVPFEVCPTLMSILTARRRASDSFRT